MAAQTGELEEDMSIIPYDTNRQVVLRHASSMVVFDPKSKQLALVNTANDTAADQHHPTECPMCHRAWGPGPIDGTETASEFDEQPNIINSDYFRMLHQSRPGSAESSVPPSPRRRLVQPVGSPLAQSTTLPPPEGAEFIGSSPAPPSQSHGISETAFAPNYFEKFFTVEKELGRGGRGVVLLVKHILDGVTLGFFACKRVPIGDDHAWLEKVLVEVQLLQNLSHQNLVSYRHVWLEDYQLNTFGPSVPCAFILQQFCNGGDMHNYVCGPAQASTTTQELKERIRRRSKGETEMPRKLHEPRKLHFDEIYSFFRDITSGLRFLHLNGFIHRDLKPSNCLLHTTGHETRVLVSDFGEVQYEYATRKSSGATGTISYCAPEVLRPVSPGGPLGNFTFKSDIFSLGMILYFLCFATLPYLHANVLHEEREDVDLLRAEITSWQGFNEERKLRPELPEKLYAFLKRLLSLNPDHRPTAEEVNNGIRTGGLEEPSLRRRDSMNPEELTPGRRIKPVDSPIPSRSPDRNRTAHTTPKSRVLPPHLRPRPLSHDPPSVNDNEIFEESQEYPSRVDGTAPSSSQQLIIHRRGSSTVSSPLLPSAPPESPFRSTPLLLPPSPGGFFTTPTRTRVSASMQLHITTRMLRTLIASLKLLSLFQPCAARPLNPVIFYPLSFLALIELGMPRLRVWQAILFAVAHGIVLAVALSRGSLCPTK